MIDAPTLRRALYDFFRFNPKDFTVQATGTGYAVQLASTRGRASSGSGAINNILLVGQSVSGSNTLTTASGDFATVSAAITAAEPTVDTAAETAFQSNLNAGSWQVSRILSTEFPLLVNSSVKQITLNGSGSAFSATLFERKYANTIMLSAVAGSDFRYRISYKVTRRVVKDGVTTDTVLAATNFLTPVTEFTGIRLAQLTGAPDITTEAWPDVPLTGDGTINSVTLLYEVTNVQFVF